MTTINTTFFIFICICAVIGALVLLGITLVIVAAIISGIATIIEQAKLEAREKHKRKMLKENQND